jgi:8-amino-7-oxononanoate synthase
LQRWQLLNSETPIQPIVIGANQPTLDAAAALRVQALWVAAIRPPTVPANSARLRVTLSAAHSSAQVAQLAQAINQLESDIVCP